MVFTRNQTWLEDTLLIGDVPNLKPPFLVDVQLPRLMTRGYMVSMACGVYNHRPFWSGQQMAARKRRD